MNSVDNIVSVKSIIASAKLANKKNSEAQAILEKAKAANTEAQARVNEAKAANDDVVKKATKFLDKIQGKKSPMKPVKKPTPIKRPHAVDTAAQSLDKSAEFTEEQLAIIDKAVEQSAEEESEAKKQKQYQLTEQEASLMGLVTPNQEFAQIMENAEIIPSDAAAGTSASVFGAATKCFICKVSNAPFCNHLETPEKDDSEGSSSSSSGCGKKLYGFEQQRYC